MTLEYRINAAVDRDRLNELHAAAFAHDYVDFDWTRQLEKHSLGWVTAHDADALVGFVNVAWDGGVHAFILDTSVRPDRHHHGIGTELVRLATDIARDGGCTWLHVDFEPDLSDFYLNVCGFRAADGAGLISLK